MTNEIKLEIINGNMFAVTDKNLRAIFNLSLREALATKQSHFN